MTNRLLFLFVSLFTVPTFANANSFPDYTALAMTIPCTDKAPTEGLEGTFIRYNMAIMWRFEGQWRWVRNIETLNNLFSGIYIPPGNITHIISPLGEYLEADCELIREFSTQKVFFREGRLIRHIYTLETLLFYHFNRSTIRNVNCLTGYVIGNQI